MDFADIFLNITKSLQDFDLGKFIAALIPILIVIYYAFAVFLSLKTFKDASKRTNDKLLIFVFTVFVLFTGVAGYILYSIIRPKDLLHEQHILKLEKFLLEYETRGVGKCRVCKSIYFPEHTYCTNCGTLVRAKCNLCANIIELDWNVCPYCGDRKKLDLPTDKKKSVTALSGGSSAKALETTQNV